MSCINNVKQLTLACLNYDSHHGALPYARKADLLDAYTWTQLILPQIEQQDVQDMYFDLFAENGTVSAQYEYRPFGPDPRKRTRAACADSAILLPQRSHSDAKRNRDADMGIFARQLSWLRRLLHFHESGTDSRGTTFFRRILDSSQAGFTRLRQPARRPSARAGSDVRNHGRHDAHAVHF